MENPKYRFVNGYVMVYRPDCPNAMSSRDWEGWVYEHVAVMYDQTGKKIEDGNYVHHLDGNKMNNSPDNLILLSPHDHSKLHRWIRNGTAYSESVCENGMNSVKPKSHCRRCKSCEYPLKDTQKIYCSRKCQGMDGRSTERPDRETLATEIELSSFSALGRKYGVSDNAIRKWAKSYDLTW